MSPALRTTTLVAALGSGLVAGVWFAFSGFVLAGLDELPPAQAVAAMQAINRTAVHAPLMIALFGTGALCLYLAVRSWRVRHDRHGRWVLAGSLLYLLGSVVVTGAANVPLNDTLAAVHAHGTGAARAWDDYLTKWGAWNVVRTVTTLGAAALLTLGLRREG